MDPIDREKPWGRFAQFLIITSVIGSIYLVFRFAVVVPEWGWRLIAAATAAGTATYFFLMIERSTTSTREIEERRRKMRPVLAVLMVATLTAPIWLVLYLLYISPAAP